MGTLGRCVLEPSERCAPHADMYASRYLVVETVNNLKIIERGREARPLTATERNKIQAYLCGPLGLQAKGKSKGQSKRSVTVSDLRELMDWGRATSTSPFRFNIESDENRNINTDWFSREIIHGAVGIEKWTALSERVQQGINHAILKFDPDEEKDTAKLKAGIMDWAALKEGQADALIAAWKKRPRPDAKRLNMSRRAVRNILTVMDRKEPWIDASTNGQPQWLTQIAARKMIAKMNDFLDATTGKPLDCHTRRRYATGAKGATKRDRHYLRKHILKKNGKPIIGFDGKPLSEPPPAPLISNPVVRKAIHEVRRHLIEYMITFERKPDEVRIELSREARMGKKQADELLFKNRLRSRIKNDILISFKLDSVSSTQQRAAFERVVLAIQQDQVCPLCGKGGLTPNLAARGSGCEIAHILPRGGGGDNGWKNIVLAHDECNRKMGRRTPRQFWEEAVPGGFDDGMAWIEKMYASIERPKPSEIKTAEGNSLWLCYFNRLDDLAKISQFKKDIKDIQGMTARQDAATKYATRQVMAYLADALFDGNGLPERGGERRIFATDGIWTARLRREWGLFFDPHHFEAKGLTDQVERERKEKNRGDHRHHAIDAIVIGYCTVEVQGAWRMREEQADCEGLNTADEQQMENYRRLHPLDPPKPYKTRDEFREAVRCAVFGDGQLERPICHRPVKRKLIGALHEETLFGPVVDRQGKLTENYSAKKSVLQLDPNHLRLPRDETPAEAIERLAQRYLNQKLDTDIRPARKRAKAIVSSKAYTPRKIDPAVGKSGLVRDLALRKRIRECLSAFSYAKKNKSGETIGEPTHINPDDFTQNEIKQAYEAGAICHKSGVPIRSIVLLRAMSDPVVISRWATEHTTGNRFKLYDGLTGKGDASAARAYVGGNNHHIEIRVSRNKKGQEVWSGKIVTTFEANQRKLARLQAMRETGIPTPAALRKFSKPEREKFKPLLREIENAHPIVDRSDNDEKGGKFVMSICEGEMLLMKHKNGSGEVGYFVVAKLDKPQGIVLVPHWDARSATQRKDAEGKKVPDSEREQFTITPSDLKELAPPEHPHAVKIQVSPLGKIRWAND
ncbi:MAG TPA: HNH endonuclease domain-containing protein [Pirellulales bacterium]|nr:HNH endonuclease domain-containing protein [Pirellulales bacterium]